MGRLAVPMAHLITLEAFNAAALDLWAQKFGASSYVEMPFRSPVNLHMATWEFGSHESHCIAAMFRGELVASENITRYGLESDYAKITGLPGGIIAYRAAWFGATGVGGGLNVAD